MGELEKSDVEKANKTDKKEKYIDNIFDEYKSLTDSKIIGTDFAYKHKVVWPNAIGFFIIHILALYGLCLVITGAVKWKTTIWTIFVLYFATEGVTIGAHRLYTHKSFKAKPLLRAILLLAQTIAGQNSVFTWCRDHRLHHRYSDTDGDPHNSKRGFFFSHIGWLMSRKHPYVIELGRKIDMSDLKADWMVMFQNKYYYYLYVILAIIIPVWVPVQYFGETWLNSFFVAYFLRWVLELNGTWLVNSAAHLYGTRPYDKKLQPVESWFVSFISLGEGWHNYHHAYPWDYKAAEWDMHFNFSASLIRLFEKIGLAYDLKSVTPEEVKNRIQRSGDGTHWQLGSEEARKAVTTSFKPLHPLNPTYTVTYPAPRMILQEKGLPLYDT